MKMTVKNQLAMTMLGAVALSVGLIATPASAQNQECRTEIQAIDQVISQNTIEAETLARVSALRESALIKDTNGDTAGCMQDVSDIKALLGL